MSWLITLILTTLVVLVFTIDTASKAIQALIIRASDLNLGAQSRIIERLEALESHLEEMPKMAKPWERDIDLDY